VLSFGTRPADCLAAADRLAAMGLSTTVADARFSKPLDTLLIDQLARHHDALVTAKDGSIGRFGSLVLHHLARSAQLDRGLTIRTPTLPDVFIDHDKPERMYESAGLDAAGIVVRAATEALGITLSEPGSVLQLRY